MANYTITNDCVQGLPQVGTNSKSADPRSDVAIATTQAGTGYFYRGAVTAQANISASQPRIDALIASGALTLAS